MVEVEVVMVAVAMVAVAMVAEAFMVGTDTEEEEAVEEAEDTVTDNHCKSVSHLY